MTIDKKFFLMTVGIAGLVVDHGLTSAVQEKPVAVSPVLSGCLHNRNDLHCQYSYANAWEDCGIGGNYPIADTRVARRECSLSKNSVDSLLGFCRALQVYRCPSPSAQTFLRKTSPYQPWLEGIYQKNSHVYRQWMIRDADKPAVEVLSYCTCTDLPWQEIKDHLSEVRRAIDSNAWTLADAYEFLCVYPKSSFFTRGWFSAADGAEYALCIADSIKLILQSEKGLTWEEIVKKTKAQEAAANDKLERYASWGSQDVQLLKKINDEKKFRNMTKDERREAGLSQEERDRLYKLDVVRAYLYAE